LASRRRKTVDRRPSKTESRAEREARERAAARRVERERHEAARLRWEEFQRRSKASKLGHKRKRAREIVPQIGTTDKAIKAKISAVKKKRAERKGQPANTDVYSREEQRRDKEEIERLRAENEALRTEVEKVIDRSGWVNILPPEWVRDDGTVALNRCRLRHTPDAARVQALLEDAHEEGGREGVRKVVRNLAKYYDDLDVFPDDDPMTEHEIWTLFFSP
jgi:hypothetical protein